VVVWRRLPGPFAVMRRCGCDCPAVDNPRHLR